MAVLGEQSAPQRNLHEPMPCADTSSVTASRTCRTCGAHLSGTVRWCGQCHEPVRELTAREPVWHDGEFVDQPIHTGGAVPHWSRWEKSATTFGPVGRITITTFAVLWVMSAAIRSPLTIVFVLPLVVVLIRSVWQRGWVVPAHLTAKHAAPAAEPESQGRWADGEIQRAVVIAVISLAGGAVLFSVDDPIPRFIVVVTAIVALAAWALRKVGDS